jgi:hypothetical protein
MSSDAPAAVCPSIASSGRSGPAAGSGRRPNRETPRLRLDPASENERALYGKLLDEVRFLRQRGFGVHREGRKFRVGNSLVSARRLKIMAARERRLLSSAWQRESARKP